MARMKNNRSFVNIEKLVSEGKLHAICWIMLVYDAKIVDMNRIGVSIKAKIKNGDEISNVFFQDVMIDLDGDVEYIKEILKISSISYPENSLFIEGMIKKVDEWRDFNASKSIKDVSPNMFSTNIK